MDDGFLGQSSTWNELASRAGSWWNDLAGSKCHWGLVWLAWTDWASHNTWSTWDGRVSFNTAAWKSNAWNLWLAWLTWLTGLLRNISGRLGNTWNTWSWYSSSWLENLSVRQLHDRAILWFGGLHNSWVGLNSTWSNWSSLDEDLSLSHLHHDAVLESSGAVEDLSIWKLLYWPARLSWLSGGWLSMSWGRSNVGWHIGSHDNLTLAQSGTWDNDAIWQSLLWDERCLSHGGEADLCDGADRGDWILLSTWDSGAANDLARGECSSLNMWAAWNVRSWDSSTLRNSASSNNDLSRSWWNNDWSSADDLTTANGSSCNNGSSCKRSSWNGDVRNDWRGTWSDDSVLSQGSSWNDRSVWKSRRWDDLASSERLRLSWSLLQCFSWRNWNSRHGVVGERRVSSSWCDWSSGADLEYLFIGHLRDESTWEGGLLNTRLSDDWSFLVDTWWRGEVAEWRGGEDGSWFHWTVCLNWLTWSSDWASLDNCRTADNLASRLGSSANDASLNRRRNRDDLGSCDSLVGDQSLLQDASLHAWSDVSGSNWLGLNNSQWLAVRLSDDLGRKTKLSLTLVTSDLLRNLRDKTRLRVDNRGVKHQFGNQSVLTAGLGAGNNFRSRAIDCGNAGASSRDIRDTWVLGFGRRILSWRLRVDKRALDKVEGSLVHRDISDSWVRNMWHGAVVAWLELNGAIWMDVKRRSVVQEEIGDTWMSWTSLGLVDAMHWEGLEPLRSVADNEDIRQGSVSETIADLAIGDGSSVVKNESALVADEWSVESARGAICE